MARRSKKSKRKDGQDRYMVIIILLLFFQNKLTALHIIEQNKGGRRENEVTSAVLLFAIWSANV